MIDKTKFYTFQNGVTIANCTPHSIWFQESDGTNILVEPCGATLLATPQEAVVDAGVITLVKTSFIRSDNGNKEVHELEQANVYPVGSIISAQAWPRQVFSLVSVPGFERVKPDDKLYFSDKFNVF